MTQAPQNDHFGNPVEIGREYVYAYFNRTSIAFRRVVVTGFTPTDGARCLQEIRRPRDSVSCRRRQAVPGAD